MNFFKNAFANEEMDKPKAPGGVQKKTVEVKVLGKPMQAIPGQRLKDIVRSSRAPIKRVAPSPPSFGGAERNAPPPARRFNCENGKCGTCESKVNGKKARICTLAVPASGCTITRL